MPETETALQAVGHRLRLLRELTGLGQQDMAHRLNVSGSTWNNWEHGRKRINLTAALRLADHLGVSLDYIYRGRLDGVSVQRAIELAHRAQWS